MKKALLIFALFIYAIGFSQISPKFYGEAEDFTELSKRTLLVQLVVENPKIIKRLSSEKEKPELDEYLAFIKSYNINIKKAAEKYWKFNQKIEFKTPEEIDVYRKSKSKDYAVLAYFELGDMGSNLRSRLTVPALYYTRIEEDLRKLDSKIYFPSSYTRKTSSYLEADYKFILIAFQDHLNWLIKNDKTVYFNDYAEKLAETNCPKLKNKTLLVQNDMVYKDKNEEAKSNYGGNLKFVSEEELNEAYLNNKKDTAVLFTIPYGVLSGSIGPIGSSSLVFFKVIVDCETNEILYCYNPGSRAMGKHLPAVLISSDFKDISKCKM